MANNKDRSSWIDTVKGLGIIMVVAGHIFSGYGIELIYVFHMPLFFFISGYLFKVNSGGTAYFVKKVRHLIIPYTAFLVVFGAPRLIKMIRSGDGLVETIRLLVGGRGIGGPMAVFWFMTCLFLTQQLTNYSLRKFSTKVTGALAFGCLLLGYLNAEFPEFWLPLNANVVVAAVPYFFVGYVLKNVVVKDAALFFVTVVAFLSMILVYLGVELPQDMKNSIYGLPFVSFFIAIGMILAFMRACLFLSQITVIGAALSSIGRYSMGIMFMHMSIAVSMLRAFPDSSSILRFFCAITLAYAITLVLNRYGPTRVIFLGSDKVYPDSKKPSY